MHAQGDFTDFYNNYRRLGAMLFNYLQPLISG
jgi:hypothetical protein